MGELYLFSSCILFLNFEKNANSVKYAQRIINCLVLFQLVWRQLEFAFFGALTPVGALFYFGFLISSVLWLNHNKLGVVL